MGEWIDGTRVAEAIKRDVAREAARLQEAGVQPGLAVVLVGTNPASQVYVRSKGRTSRDLGMLSETLELPAETTTEELLSVVQTLNARAEIHGILVQVPLPPHVDARRVLESIDPAKDVDGFHPVNVGRLVAGTAALRPCTPAGIIEMLRRYGISMRGSRAVVIGRSDIVGKPVALLLMHEDATVTICHSKTADLRGVARQADILVVAMGRPAAVDDTYVKEGAVVIDVGVNRVDSAERVRALYGDDPKRAGDLARKGYTLVGDVDAGRVLPKAKLLTPVPGGVGPLTIAMLMANTVRAAAAAARIPVFQ
jgi:methylenetetrahydrofolate dehydrogenase (NADP+)/methenyltetrahydrofolate cyclohydrolase